MSPRRLILPLLTATMWLGACGSPCQEALGGFPPDQIVVTGGESVAVPHIAWECPGFHSDSMDPPPVVTPIEGSIRVEVSLDPEATIDVRLGNQSLELDPSPDAGENSWVIPVSSPSEPLVVRICSAEQACAMYWANLYTG